MKRTKVKKCKVTGLDISMQKRGTKILDVAGVEFYHNEHPEIYMELDKRFGFEDDDDQLEDLSDEQGDLNDQLEDLYDGEKVRELYDEVEAYFASDEASYRFIAENIKIEYRKMVQSKLYEMGGIAREIEFYAFNADHMDSKSAKHLRTRLSLIRDISYFFG